ncbi:hypothetical protein HIM_07869 [Hirsutella minnesotensis 3608]|uniref:Uncharacterized protein n=1 Tax=Hirsutella minnesotensis 3608 TaxID=1043627 RepID=A0A0F7ZYL4_9HYPO|nr:hypothetical protein HIM_07869 [Hirsutella minnesotensis 3608]
MADTIRGDGLFRADATLAALAEDPERLDRARSRFGDSLPSYKSQPSGTTTRFQSLNPPSEETRRREEQKWQLIREHEASLPSEQFDAQRHEEERRILIAKADENGTRTILPDETWLPDSNIITLAGETVKKRWVEQGIWNDKWKDMNPWKYDRPSGPWKHEEPLELESESETNSEAKGNTPLFPFSRKTGEAKPRRPSDDTLRLIAERRAICEREREASRPFYQFIYQVSKERERMQDESRSEGPVAADSVDINTKAYENVKNIWIKRQIWNRKWGILPGMCWKHEQPLDEMLAEEMGPDPAPCQANPPEGDGRGVGEASHAPRQIFGPPPPANLNHSSLSGLPNVSQELSAALDQPGLQNSNANHSFTASNVRRRLTESGQDARSAAGQRPRGERAPSPKEGRAQRTAGKALGPVHPGKVSKAQPRGKGPGPRRGRNASELPSDAQPSLTDLDLPEPPPVSAPVPPRRSRRLRETNHGASTDPAAVASADSLNGVSPSLPRRTAAGSLKPSGSAKPRGVSKRQYPSTRRLWPK